jgi:AraC-like DNA-binding protein
MSNYRLIQKALPEQELFGIELHPPALKKLLKIPSGEFLNTIVDVETINKDFKLLWELLAVAHSFDDRVHIAEQWMIKNISIIHARDMAVSSFLDQQLPAVDVSSLAAQLCYSPRQLHRKSREYFGMSTEALISYKRYLDALRLMHNSKESLTSISYESQYFDQPHFNREFKEYTGLTPGEYRNRKSNLPGHLFE